jgi:hypothetical protein
MNADRTKRIRDTSLSRTLSAWSITKRAFGVLQTAIGWFGSAIVRLIRPTLVMALYVNGRKIKAVDFDERKRYWEGVVTTEGQRLTTQIAYDTAVARQTGLESKAVGILQAGGLVAAGALVAVASDGAWTRLLGLSALGYLAAASWATGLVLVPAPRRAVVIDDAAQESAIATVAACVSSMQPLGLRTSNLVTSGAEDLGRAAVLTLAALLLTVL